MGEDLLRTETSIKTEKEAVSQWSEEPACQIKEETARLNTEELLISHQEVIPEKNIAPHPWRRYFARTFDLFGYSIIWIFIQQLILRWDLTAYSIIDTLVGSYVSCGLMLLLEPILLSSLGTTPGKWILGLVVRDSQGRKLTYRVALNRVLELFGKGMGFNIPIYSIVRLVSSYRDCEKGEIMWWDDGITYEVKGNLGLRSVAYVAFHIVMFFLVILIALQTYMPINRGDLTAKEFYENCNQQMKFLGVEYGKTLGEDGKWIDNNESFYIEYFGIELPTYELTLENGLVKEVKIETESQNGFGGAIENNADMAVGILSFVAAQKEINCISLHTKGVLDQLKKSFENYEMEVAGVKITNHVEYRGYELLDNVGGQVLFPIDGEELYFKRVFKMEKI